MRLFVVFAVLAVALADDKVTDKRGADVQYVTSPKTTSVTAGLSSAATPSYQSKAQTYVTRPSYVQSQGVTYEQQQVAQPIVKYAFAGQPSAQTAYKVAAQPVAYTAAQPQYNYQYEQPQYYLQQPEVKYSSLAQTKAVAAAPPKIQYTAPAAVTYQAAAAGPSGYTAQVSAQPHYSPAGSVSSFHFSNPHVSYSNLGLLSQVIGKAYSPQAHAAQQAVVSHSAPQVSYTSQAAPQVAYASQAASPQYVSAAQYSPQIQYSQQPQYVPQHYSSSPQVQYVSQQPSHSSPQVQYVSQQASHSSPQYIYSSPPKGYSSYIH